MDQYFKIGGVIPSPPPDVFQLVIEDHITWADPKSYGVSLQGINPKDYFVTSGDAVQKATHLDKDLWHLAGTLRKELFAIIAEEQQCSLTKAQEFFRGGIRPNNMPRLAEYEAAVWKMAGQARKLLAALIQVKGSNIFLETEWSDHLLLCIPKNPRK